MIQRALGSDGKDPLPMVQRVPVRMLAKVHLSHEEDNVVLFSLLGRQRRGQLGAVHAHEASYAEFDEVAVQEEGLKVVEIPRVGLKHGHAAAGWLVVALVEMLCFKMMRD